MELSNEEIRTIEAYLQGELSQTEQQQFEDRLQNETAFAKAFSDWKDMLQHLRLSQEEQQRRIELKEKWLAYDAQHSKTPVSSGIGKYKWLLGVAIAGGGVFALTHLLDGKEAALDNEEPATRPLESADPPIPEEIAPLYPPVAALELNPLVEQYLEFYPREDRLLSSSSGNIEDWLTNAHAAYDVGNYAEAVPLFKLALEAGTAPREGLFAGVAALQLGQGAMSIDFLKPLLEEQSLMNYYNDIRFHLALAFLQEEDVVNARLQLNEIIDAGEDFTLEAKELLEKI
ncbi:MAG: hypothetical protein AAF433_19960 [Bacteroidota bacterium]